MTKQNCLQSIGKEQQEDANKKSIKRTPAMDKTHKEFVALNKQIEELGYREMPQEQYEKWIKSVEEEKQKTTTNKN